MLSFEKNPNSLSLFVKEDNVVIDEIFYSNIDDLCDHLKEDYYLDLMCLQKIVD